MRQVKQSFLPPVKPVKILYMSQISFPLLIVEDDAALRLMLCGIGESMGFMTHPASTRDEALLWLSDHHQPCLVLLDLGLPPYPQDTREGLALLHHIQHQAVPAKTVVLSGQDYENATLAAIRAGAFDFIAKPSTTEQIMAALNRALLFMQKETDMRDQGLSRMLLDVRLGDGLKAAREDAEERLVRGVLRETRFNIHESARRLGIKRENVYYFLKKFGIERQQILPDAANAAD